MHYGTRLDLGKALAKVSPGIRSIKSRLVNYSMINFKE